MEDRVLVLLSSYNGEEFIAAQIDSIMNQQNVNLELRIRDDGSTDNTCAVIEKKQKEYPDKIELIRGENVGYNASFFELINHADSYDYYSLSDQDDVWLPSKLEVALKALHAEDDTIPLLYASTSYLVKNDLKPCGQTRKKQKPFTIYNTIIQNICPGHTQVLNNALIKLVQGEHVDPSRVYVYDSWITNVAALYGKIIFNNSSFTYYRQHEDNQLGSGVGKLGKLFSSGEKTGHGDAAKYKEQMEYFAEMNADELRRQGYLGELENFFNAKRKSQKIRYLSTSKLYRQSEAETVAFKGAVLAGEYDSEKDSKKKVAKFNYSFSERTYNGICLINTKLNYKGARLIRLPFICRGKEYIDFGSNLTIGRNCQFEVANVHDHTCLKFGDHVNLGHNVRIQCIDEIDIGSNVLMGSRVTVIDHSHGKYSGDSQDDPETAPNKRQLISAPIYIGNNVWIGEDVTILPGVTIGDGSVIGSNAVVSRDIPAGCIAAGVPARIIKKYDFNTKEWRRVNEKASN